ncbi:Major facilitator superfamily (MFS) protein [Aromatoleum bremense]|uniref:MFS transporter n=2 Tax=Aromatoleum bremense TaxID=76115 RepID=A0ABX1NUV6_9RHOO|nr:MFS transporter [Aromatoleum bremense]QTQ30288.1 Major facilitator superfamily (MFS) protein [Aromatoleum bremense]
MVLFLTTVVQSLTSMAALMVPVLAPRMAVDLGLPPATVGYYIALVFLAAIPATVLGGDAVIRFGPIRVSQAGLVICAIGLALLCVGSPWLCLLGALLIGFGYGPVTPASSHMLSLSTPQRNLGLVFSVKQTGVPLGGALAGFFAPMLEASVGWQGALLAVACLLCCAATQSLRTPHDDDRIRSHTLGLGVFRELARLLARSPSLRTLAFASFCFSTFQLSLTTYLVTYLHETFGYTLVAAGLTMSAAQASGVIGRILWGIAADRWLGSVRMLAALAVAMAAGAAVLAGMPATWGPWPLMAVVCIVSACALGWNGTFLAEVARQAPSGAAGRATGAILSCTFAGVVVGPPLFGIVASLTGGYRLAFAVIAAGPAIAAIALYLKRSTFRTST